MNPAKKRMVACPTCNTPTPYDASNKFRPFCSERCQQIDLGQWASEQYRISQPAGTPPQDLPEH